MPITPSPVLPFPWQPSPPLPSVSLLSPRFTVRILRFWFLKSVSTFNYPCYLLFSQFLILYSVYESASPNIFLQDMLDIGRRSSRDGKPSPIIFRFNGSNSWSMVQQICLSAFSFNLRLSFFLSLQSGSCAWAEDGIIWYPV